MTVREVGTKDDGGRVPGASGTGPGLARTLLRAAWLAILLGLAMEGLLLLASGFGGAGPLAADLVKNVSWSVFVCAGLAIGTAASKIRPPLMGFLGLFTAPLAFEASRALHKGTLEALSVASGPEALSPLLVAVIKGVEYGCLGLLVGRLGGRPWGGAAAHVAAGLGVGTLFGGAILALTYASSPATPETSELLSKAINEVLFPVGCSLVLYSAGALAKKTGGADGAPGGSAAEERSLRSG